VRDQQTSRFFEGARAVSPILIGVVPFGLIFGVTASAASVSTWATWASSFIIFAGAAQLAVVDILGSGGTAAVAILTAVVINARHLMYSADLGSYTGSEPLRSKISMAYVLTDQAYLIWKQEFPDPGASTGYRSYYLGGALTLWMSWQISTSAGFVLGAAIPASWSLEFAIPLTFLALLVLAVKDKPGLVAAVAGGAVALAAVSMPYNLGLVMGAIAGVGAGLVSERWLT